MGRTSTAPAYLLHFVIPVPETSVSETPALTIQHVDARSGSAAILADLREKLSPRGDVVSPRGRELTLAVFGKPLTPVEVVETICRDVQNEGTAGLLRYTAALDRVELTSQTLRVPAADLAAAHAAADQAAEPTQRPAALLRHGCAWYGVVVGHL